MNRRRPLIQIFSIIMVMMASLVVLAGPFAPYAYAQPEEAPPVAGAGVPTAVTANIPDATKSVYKNILTQITRALVIAFFNAAQLFAGRLAYEAANYIAAGGKGQEAQFFTKDFGKHLESVGQDAIGEGIGSLSDSTFFKTVGFDLCKPNVGTLLRLQLSLGNFFPGLTGAFERPRPRCEFKNIVNNWDSFGSSLSKGDLYNVIDANLDTSKSDIGVSAKILGDVTVSASAKISDAIKQREEGKGFKSVQSFISGRIKTPADVVSESTKEEVIRKPNATQIQQTGTILANAFKEGPIQLASYTASVFLNTLASKFMKRIFEKGLGAFDFSEAVQHNVVGSPDAVVTAGKTDVRAANIDLKTPNLQKTSDFEVVVELVACPQENRGLWNCSVDQKFAQAIQSQGEQGAFTIGEAMDRDFLHKKWKLFPIAMTKETQDANCYQYGYCAGNLQKLRAARILPVGFEMAANTPENVERCRGADGCIKLEDVVRGFSVCNEKGERDATHPWCHLIDPNWVITAPPQQCVLSGFGDNVLSSQLNQRRQECQDVQTCLKRNNQGECVGGYGYCMAEKTVYRIQATECSARYASCRNYQPRVGQAVSYLRNTLDYGQCNADNVGCLWYATERDPKNASQDAWVATISEGPRLYFDKTVTPCSASDEGCTKVLMGKAGESALNLLLNPSFERTVGTDAPSLADWLPAGSLFVIPTVATGTPSVEGAAVLELRDGDQKEQVVSVSPSRMYSVSVYARAIVDGDKASFKIELPQYQDLSLANLVQESGRDFRSFGCEPGPAISLQPRAFLNSAWQRFECSFLTAPSARALRVRITGNGKVKILMDALQLEEGEYATDFVDGVSKNLAETHLKIAPDEYDCQGEKTDPAICAKFAKVCRQSEAGCDGYKDVVGGGAEIPALVSQNDFCFDSCVGYNEYRKTPSSFDLVRDVDPRFDDSTDTGQEYFIPSTAQACSQEDVGCEAFTNVEPSVEGGERQAFFSYVRACEKPDQNSKTFFTWEGSDVTGFQLRTWSLKRDVAPHPPEPGGGPAMLVKRGPDQITLKDPAACNETTWKTGFDPDCRQFYDADGHVFYRYFSHTILSSDQCAAYRLNGRNRNDCEKTGGTFTPATGECLYHVHAPESRACNAQAVSCRAYAGAESGNVENIFSDNFRSGTSTFVNGTRSGESLLVGDSSWRVNADNKKVAQTSVKIKSSEKDLFRVTFWAKAPVVKTPTTLVLSIAATSADPANKRLAAGSVQITTDWQRFSIGPVSAWRGATSTVLAWSSVTPILFLDEVTVVKIPDMAYVRAGTWVTPNECDTSLAGVPQPRAMLGCRAYQNRDKQTLNLRQFTRLCRQEAISCKTFIDTRNSDDVGAKTFVMKDTPPLPKFGAATVIRAADRYRYLIDDPAKHCQPENASCRAFGKPNFTQDRLQLNAKTPFTTVYYKDDIKKYDQALCKPSEIFCEEFTGPAGKEYFRNPGDHVCEYKENQALKNGTYFGWFQKGTTIPCYPEFLESGQTFQLAKNGDTKYQGWGGLCPREAGECTEIRDPNDTSDPLHKTGKPYFYIYDREKFDTASCGGEVNVGKGCVLLNNLGDSQSKWSVAASYAKYQKNNFNSTPPVDCAVNPQEPTCQGNKNDANLLLKVNIDRDCAQWLGCKSAETVLDRTSGKYKDVCTNLALCDKASETPGDIFCSNYVKRDLMSKEPVLTQGAFFDINRYTRRKVGLGEKDYSGYTIPNAFQVTDLTTARVGVDGVGKFGNNEQRYALDYRLAAVSVIRVKSPSTQENESRFLDKNNPADALLMQAYPQLKLCRHNGTGMLGYYRLNDLTQAKIIGGSIKCYLAIQGEADLSSITNLVDHFTSSSNPQLDPALLKTFPPAECRSNPEPDAPFRASFVTAWDLTKNPPQPTAKLQDFASANTCEYGEDCACAYKRVEYRDAGINKFYDPFSQKVPPGVCQGGPRAGEACLPDTVFKIVTKDPNNPGAQAAEAANASLTCGASELGGKCVAFSKAQIVRGVFGQCLERDWTRNVGNDLSQHPCLTWNPTPILFGEKDANHYVPTAGYSPPENSGQYYCLSEQKPSRVLQLDSRAFEGSEKEKKPFAGTMFDFYYQSNWTSDGSCWDCVGHSDGIAATLDGSGTSGSAVANQCEHDADGIQASGGRDDVDGLALRIVSSGRNLDKSYTETFFQYIGESKKDTEIGYIRVAPFKNPSGKGRLSCGYQADWVDELGDVDYGDPDSLRSKDVEWHQKFSANYNPAITRGTTKYVDNGSKEKPILLAVQCVGSTDMCYFKTWETGYRDEGQDKFVFLQDQENFTFTIGKQGSFNYMRGNPHMTACKSDKPYFSIRAVFETPAIHQDGSKVKEEGFYGAPANDANKEWQLKGFWVSTCAGKANDVRYIYMNIDINTAGVCEQLAEVRSSYSHQDAAFTDRVWKSGNFTAPGVGYQYGSRFAPFSSALNTGPAGNDPLFQTGGAVAGFSPLKPPTFIGSGVGTYYREDSILVKDFLHPDPPGVGDREKGKIWSLYPPYQKWGYLTNLFARIYRIYNWDPEKNGSGYVACKGKGDEFCGLTAYNISHAKKNDSLNPYISELPTDVTPGHYTPLYLGLDQSLDPKALEPSLYSYLSYYTPRPPRIAAPDLRACSSPGQCGIQRLDMFSFNNQSEGIVNAGGGQHKATLRFYGWASHEQMPLRSVVVDWGDGDKQELPDAKLKNHKPMCATQSECSDPVRGWGLTCNTDSDCPPGAGKCAPLGTCLRRQNIFCHTDSDCTNGKQKDICTVRTLFGNSTEACEPNYFEFSHLYECGGKIGMQTCEYERTVGQGNFIEGRCSRDSNRGCTTAAQEAGGIAALRCAAGDVCIPTGLAPNNGEGGCWDEKTNSCRFTPRVLLQDNWGWCSGECRDDVVSGTLQDKKPPSNNVLHTYGGCYAWGTHGAVEANIQLDDFNDYFFENECKQENPNLQKTKFGNYRPWIVYPGSLQLRSSGELQNEPIEPELEKDKKEPPPPIGCKDTYSCPKGCVLDKSNPKKFTCEGGDGRCNNLLPECPRGCQFDPDPEINNCVVRKF